jgi:S1-C subfamily serine protease
MNRSTPSQFALLSIEGTLKKAKSISLSPSVVSVRQGEDIYCVSSPFGVLSRDTFQNSVTKGIVSNIITTRDESQLAILTDARMLPGSEGGGLFQAGTGECIAVITIIIVINNVNRFVLYHCAELIVLWK